MPFPKAFASVVAITFILIPAAATVEGQTVFVDAGATGADDGTSWANAYADLQNAITASVSGDQIWVATGIYTPAVAGSPTSSTFSIPDGVALYGGFAGSEDPNTFDLTTRDFATNETILSGDLDGDDPSNLIDVLDCRIEPFGGPLPDKCSPFDTGDSAGTIVEAELNMDDNTRHVVTILNSGTTTRIDGFTITAGSAEATSNPARFGGGLFNDDGSPTVANCKFMANYGQFGGGLMIDGISELVVDSCSFVGNTGSSGGGIYSTANGVPTTITNSIFRNNSAHFGGGIRIDNKASVTNCVFANNKAVSVNLGTGFGGGIYVFSGDNDLPTVTNCTFNLNSAGLDGGAVRTVITGTFCDFTLKNSILWDNGDEFVDACASTIEFCDIKGSGGLGVGNIDLDPLFADLDLRLSCGSPCVDAGTNSATTATTDLDGNPRVANGIIDMGAYETSGATGDPVITCPADLTIVCGDPTDPANTGVATAVDSCTLFPVLPSSFSFVDSVVPGCGKEQTITRTWTADTGSANPDSCVQIVSTVDTIAPEVFCPADIAVSGGFGGRAVSFSPSATDACDVNPSVAATPISGSFFPTGVTSVSATATDACGNTSLPCSFDVLVSCFGVNRSKIGTSDQVCRGIESIEFTSMNGTEELISLFKAVKGSGGGVEEDTLPASIVVNDGVNGPVTVDTSGAVAIRVGDGFGPYTVSDINQDFGNQVVDRGNDVQIRGSFVPAIPFDLSIDDFDISIDDGQGNVASFTIPAGSFVSAGDPAKGKLTFEGVLGTADVKVKLSGCKVDFKAKNATNTAALIGTALTIRLTVGPNTGEDMLAMEDKGNHLKFARQPIVNCCPSCLGVASMQVTSDQGVSVFVPDSGKTKLNLNTVVDDGVNGSVTIHTSCSQPIAVGDTFGAYTISELIKIFAQN